MQNRPVTLDFIRFPATDGVKLTGWLSRGDTKSGVLYVHGRAGNGYENCFVDEIRATFVKQGRTFLSIDTRGRGVISCFRRESGDHYLGGSCYEIFEESVFDIQGAINYLRAGGSQQLTLVGHSLGAGKIVNFARSHPRSVQKLILIAPTDMVGWASHDPEHDRLTTCALDLVNRGKPEALVGSSCWGELDNPLSARTYLSVCQPNTPVDIYGHGTCPAALSSIRIPTRIIYGDQDVGIVKVYGEIERYRQKINSFNNAALHLTVIKGADHGFTGCENRLAEVIDSDV